VGPEDLDQILKELPVPKDPKVLVGLDTFAHVAKNIYENVPKDEMRDVLGRSTDKADAAALENYQSMRYMGDVRLLLDPGCTRATARRSAPDGRRDGHGPAGASDACRGQAVMCNEVAK
jgi:hypothetical protein